MKGKIKKLSTRLASLVTIFVIMALTVLDSLVYRPMEAYAAATDISIDSGSLPSVIADFLMSMGSKSLKAVNAVTTALDFANWSESKRQEVLDKYPTPEALSDAAMEELFSFSYKDQAGKAKTESVTVGDVVTTSHVLDDLKNNIKSTFEIPASFVKTLRSFAAEKLNFSSSSGLLPITSKVIRTEDYVRSFRPLPVHFQSPDGRTVYRSSSPVYVAGYMVRGSGTYCVYFGKPGTVLTYEFTDTNGRVVTRNTTLGEASNSGFAGVNCRADNCSWPSLISGLEELLGGMLDIVCTPSGDEFNYTSANVSIPFLYEGTPTIDLPYAGVGPLTWNGTADLAETLKNQNEATDREAYIGKAITAVGNPSIPDETVGESESSGTGEGSGDISLSGILDWLSKLYHAVIALPKGIADAFSSSLDRLGDGVSAIPDAIEAQTEQLGKWVSTIPAALADIKDKIVAIPDNVGKELAKLGDWIQTIPAALAEVKNAVIAVPKQIADAIAAFFAIDTVRLNDSYTDMTDVLKAKFAALQQIRDIFDHTGYTFSETPPIIKMPTPDALKFAIKTEEMVIMDLRQFADLFKWCRTILAAILWVAFGKWVMDQFDVKFHVG